MLLVELVDLTGSIGQSYGDSLLIPYPLSFCGLLSRLLLQCSSPSTLPFLSGRTLQRSSFAALLREV